MRISALACRGAIGLAASVLFVGAACAHDVWNNGSPVPDWVKKMCCGPYEAHSLRGDQVKQTARGYQIDGWPEVIPYNKALPSPDGAYWAFYDNPDDGNTMNCFFAPMSSS